LLWQTTLANGFASERTIWALLEARMVDHLWAPWRMEFILRKREDGCVFCRLPAERDRLRENLILHIGSEAYVVLNRYPYTSGHLMVIPLRHTSDFLSLTAAENAEMAVQLQASIRILKKACRPEGFNLGMNLGVPAGAGIYEHLHHHVVPRWVGDNNFLPILGEARSIPEYLLDTYDRLWPHFRRAAKEGVLVSGSGPSASSGGSPEEASSASCQPAASDDCRPSRSSAKRREGRGRS
jgi:ATP adenylyltransferase